MVTDETMDALEMMREELEKQGKIKEAAGVKMAQEMLGDFDQGGWLATDDERECREWLNSYIVQ
ncbi:hypothetical protein KQI61_15540 [Anaerocolumna aminovalerica]|uniref:hypothetical protein n=1 Tax=Anaerocolumna aminovalerica TaxID=1527 RepID=UPI001C0EB039|nr:hypothetical protein [Anaerocolumna aminovalerica]MBU5333612.1 hypothetical protein [Anaerocolumna aminovalerica]